MEIAVDIYGSGRHVHLSREDFVFLFGESEDLPVKRWLNYEGGNFLSTLKASVLGTGNTEIVCGILGPLRGSSQVEISLTDAQKLGLDPPVSDSGNLEGTSPVCIRGPRNTLRLEQGLFIARRHIHMTRKDAEKLGATPHNNVCVRVEGIRGLVFHKVGIQILGENVPLSRSLLHLDYDEWNAVSRRSEGYARLDTSTL